MRRADGWVKLKPNAVPTKFDVPNPPKLLDNNRKLPSRCGNSGEANSKTVQEVKIIPIKYHF
jgi:hypothetical protein